MTPPPSRSSRTLLVVLGVFALCIACCCGGVGLLGYTGFQSGKKQDLAAKAFARTALLNGSKDWRGATMRSALSSSWKSGVSAEQDATLFGTYAKKLGPIRSLGEFTTNHYAVGSQDGLPSGTRITMSAHAKFSKADGTITLRVVNLGEGWGIETIRIESPALIK